MATPTKGKVIITRKFAYKIGLPNYSSADFECEVTDTCERKDAVRISKETDEFVRAEVRKSIESFVAGQKAKEKAEVEAEKAKAAEKHNKVSSFAEKKEKAKDAAELSAGDIEIVPEL